MEYSIVVVDDHILIAEALSGIIQKFRQYHVLYEVENGKMLIEKFRHPKNIPDIVLLDINMPHMDGFETAKWLTQYHPAILILALSMQDEEETLIKMVRYGAKGYLLKNVRPPELEKALDAVVQKGYYYPDWITHKLLLNLSSGKEQNMAIQLNERELVFLQYAASELTYKEIGEKMFCSPRTVESYRDGLFEKFGQKTRIGLVIYALKQGIIKL
ncbi:DNA-binding response regulator [Niastella yeongjuensis]|uniref:DNA-binding response regulator n=1 Tax=Niastella yeongjuensis TaxID=354355 RepID=A0A1V9F5E5_9BACT|nr:response regulator transcription factor [Niastella yeongjuensis]OQP53456.1 DNA-binding response regulator [Niastella yeongjuensis]SEP11785.1 two component transcriptional regulator, LuxR family [Niastella yeongjuensis]